MSARLRRPAPVRMKSGLRPGVSPARNDESTDRPDEEPRGDCSDVTDGFEEAPGRDDKTGCHFVELVVVPLDERSGRGDYRRESHSEAEGNRRGWGRAVSGMRVRVPHVVASVGQDKSNSLVTSYNRGQNAGRAIP